MSDDAIKYASEMVGKKPSDADLRAYLKGEHLDPRKAAWCAAFVSASLRKAGLDPPKSQMATSYLNYGEYVNPSHVRRGDIAIIGRNRDNNPIPPRAGGYGHAALVEDVDASGNITLLQGGYSNSVARSVLPSNTAYEDVTQFRRPPSPAPRPSPNDEQSGAVMMDGRRVGTVTYK